MSNGRRQLEVITNELVELLNKIEKKELVEIINLVHNKNITWLQWLSPWRHRAYITEATISSKTKEDALLDLFLSEQDCADSSMSAKLLTELTKKLNHNELPFINEELITLKKLMVAKLQVILNSNHTMSNNNMTQPSNLQTETETKTETEKRVSFKKPEVDKVLTQPNHYNDFASLLGPNVFFRPNREQRRRYKSKYPRHSRIENKLNQLKEKSVIPTLSR